MPKLKHCNTTLVCSNCDCKLFIVLIRQDTKKCLKGVEKWKKGGKSVKNQTIFMKHKSSNGFIEEKESQCCFKTVETLIKAG